MLSVHKRAYNSFDIVDYLKTVVYAVVRLFYYGQHLVFNAFCQIGMTFDKELKVIFNTFYTTVILLETVLLASGIIEIALVMLLSNLVALLLAQIILYAILSNILSDIERLPRILSICLLFYVLFSSSWYFCVITSKNEQYTFWLKGLYCVSLATVYVYNFYTKILYDYPNSAYFDDVILCSALVGTSMFYLKYTESNKMVFNIEELSALLQNFCRSYEKSQDNQAIFRARLLLWRVEGILNNLQNRDIYMLPNLRNTIYYNVSVTKEESYEPMWK